MINEDPVPVGSSGTGAISVPGRAYHSPVACEYRRQVRRAEVNPIMSFAVVSAGPREGGVAEVLGDENRVGQWPAEDARAGFRQEGLVERRVEIRLKVVDLLLEALALAFNVRKEILVSPFLILGLRKKVCALPPLVLLECFLVFQIIGER